MSLRVLKLALSLNKVFLFSSYQKMLVGKVVKESEKNGVPLGYHLETIWGTIRGTIWVPFGNHLGTIFGIHLGTIFGKHLGTIWKPFGYHLESIWVPFGYHLETTNIGI